MKHIFKSIKRACCPVLCAAFIGLCGISASAADVPETEGVVTAEPAVTEMTTAVSVNDELPYEVPESDEPATDDAQSIIDYLDVNNSTNTIDLVLLITILSIAPSLLIMLTCFTRLIISFSLLRNAMGLQQTPPNQVLVGLALFLTLFIMSPVIDEMNEAAYVPYKNGEYTAVEAINEASVPLKKWMLKNTSNESMSFIINLTDSAQELSSATGEEFTEKVPFTYVVPAFILSELKTGFQIGFLLYIPFLVIDVVVASTLMSMGMMMLPPATISMPFKLMLFVLVDGWTMLIGSLVSGFNI